MSAARTAVNDAGVLISNISPEDIMKSRRDLLKAIGGLVLATGGSWLASHAHGADTVAQADESRNAGATGEIDPAGAPDVAAESAGAAKR